MNTEEIVKLRSLTDFNALLAYLRDELDWPIEAQDAEELVFEYEPEELGIDKQYAVKIRSIKQLRPLVNQQPWGLFYLEFERKRLPVVVLRRILRAFVAARRAVDPERPVWRLADLMFISALGEADARGVSFAHFHQKDDGLPELRTFSWDQRETHFYYIKRLNLAALKWPDDETDAAAWRAQWSRAFSTPHRYSISTSQNLAKEMAKHALTVRALIDEVYALESKEGALHQLYDNFKEILLHDLSPAAFADMIAQTVAYGLLSAAAQDSQALTLDSMVAHIPKTNPFLKELLASLTEEGAVDLDELGIGELVTMLQQTNVEAILRDFGRQTGSGREDPVIHFYELFLSEYDKAQKVQRGVFYTPDPVVSFIVRSVDELLKSEFGLQDGLADTTCDPHTGEPLVQVLDPATGTGTFLAHVIDQIEQTVKAKAKNVPGASESAGHIAWNEYVSRHLLPRLNGFELMMAPYAVAHTKLGLKLQQTGYSFSSDERLRVFLCNTLEQAVEKHDMLALRGVLSKESDEAARVKRNKPITVVLGNPPYSGHSANNIPWSSGLLHGNDGETKGLANYFEVDGHGLNERNPKWLNDDYVKFIRFAQWRLERTGKGILGFITNHSYLDNPTFRGMRQALMQSFNKLYILDLHGNSLKKERTPQGGKDENVFDIQQGVAIVLAVKTPQISNVCEVFHADLSGERERKYDQLLHNNITTITWKKLSPQSEFYLFIPRNVNLSSENQDAWKITEIFPINSVGIVTSRDKFVIDDDINLLKQRIERFCSNSLTDEATRAKFDLKDTSKWKLTTIRKKLKYDRTWEDSLTNILYRPFDIKWICYKDELIERPRLEVMSHMLQENISLCFMRQVALEEDYTHVFVSQYIVDNRTFLSSKGIIQQAPLYLYVGVDKKNLFNYSNSIGKKEVNINPIIFKNLTETYGITLISEAIFHYIYAILHSPAYRARYAEFLKIDFPRIPFTSDYGLFQQLAALGADLAALHLLQDDYAQASWAQAGQASPLHTPITTFVEGVNGTTLGAFSKSSCYQNGKVFLDTALKAKSSYFAGVPEEVWNFQIGGYQVCYKWLYDRRAVGKAPGRTLTDEDIAHYHQIVIALNETLRLVRQIDAIIAEHGGFPLV